MDIKTQFLADIALQHDNNLYDIAFKVNDIDYTFYFKPLTLWEHVRINNACKRTITNVDNEGNKEIKEVVDSDLYPVYVILEKAMDKNGVKLFTLTDTNMRDTLYKKFPYDLLSIVASEMSLNVTQAMEGLLDGNRKN